MISAPAFWRDDNWVSRLLSPLSPLGAAITARRVARLGWQASVPVICCGNATVGGAGKTTLTLDLANRLTARGIAVHILLRGYGGAARGPRRVMRDDTAGLAGDEALLLAAAAPTWTGADRAASAKQAIAAGARVLLMDDGLQNSTLVKTGSLLVVDGATGFGNGRVLPAGPLREPVAQAAARCRAAVLIGPDTSFVRQSLPAGLPVLAAGLEQDATVRDLRGQPVFAFAGIAIPDKFFLTLEQAGVHVIGRARFPDHHMFTEAERADLLARARKRDAVLVTTPKDAVRLPSDFPARAVGVRLVWENAREIESILDQILAANAPDTGP